MAKIRIKYFYAKDIHRYCEMHECGTGTVLSPEIVREWRRLLVDHPGMTAMQQITTSDGYRKQRSYFPSEWVYNDAMKTMGWVNCVMLVERQEQP